MNVIRPRGLTAERVRELFDYDPSSGVLQWKVTRSNVASGSVVRSLSSVGYIRVAIDRKRYLAHHIAWLHYHGEWPKQTIDHINRVRTDNRIANLRDVDNTVQGFNKGFQSNNRSGHVGVHWDRSRRKWVAQIGYRGKHKNLGVYHTIQAAIAARTEAYAKMAASGDCR